MTRTADQIRRTNRCPRPIPPFAAPGPVTVPPHIDTELPNGLRVLLVPRPSAPTVHARVVVPLAGTGVRHPARANLLARTLFAGTNSATRLDIDTEIALLGGHLFAAVTPERLGIGAMAHARDLPTVLDVIVDALTDATYPDSEVQHERDLVPQWVAQARANPAVVATEALQRHLYGDHPATHTLPDPAVVSTLNPDEIRALHIAAMTPRGAALVLVGDLDLDHALDAVEDATAGWTSTTTAQRLPPLPAVRGGELQVANLPGAVQSHLRLAAPAVSHTDPRFPALVLATAALGGPFSSRLVEIIREEKGYCYSASAALTITRHSAGMSATLSVSMNTATDNTQAAWFALRDELTRFVAQPPHGAELERIRSHALGSQLTAIRSQQHLADTLTGLVNTDRGVDWFAIERQRLAAVTADDIAAVAQEFFSPARFTGVITGDAEALVEPLTGVDGIRMP